MRTFVLALSMLIGSSTAAPPPYVVPCDPLAGLTYGDPALFEAGAKQIRVRWDSARTNSFFYFPLPVTLTREDRFEFQFDINFAEIAIGTTPGKPYTFQIAAGLINTTNAFDPELFRGSGVNPQHGARNIVEWNYFPDSGFGATVSPTLATAENQIAFSDNHPLELSPGVNYHFQMSFSPEDQALRCTMQAGANAVQELKPLVVSAAFGGFELNAFSISNYSDAGQSPPQFSGSIQAAATVSNLSLTFYNRPLLLIDVGNLSFETDGRYRYYIESSADLASWQTASGPVNGTGAAIRVPQPRTGGSFEFYRVRAERSR